MAITFQHVTHTYKTDPLHNYLGLQDVNIHIQEGQFVGIIGASGCGKSTLLQHCNGILLPTDGTIQILDYEIRSGQKLQSLQGLRRRIGLVFQFPEQQIFEETVEKELMFGPRNFGVSEEQAKKQAEQALHAMGLPLSLLSRNPLQLSGGQMRKVAIASVLVMNPDILLLDEPTATLDPQSREELIQMLHHLCKDQGKTIVIVTHRTEEIIDYADEWIVMKQGTVVYQGNIQGMYEVSKQGGDKLDVALPKPLRFWQKLEEQFAISSQVNHYSAAHLADRISQLVNGKGGST
ncbi:ATP-binding cassette domain-containing protein [Paenibacillus sp. N1-5-1-14]|uniref:ATP-binding cassette domain-containing protein n=1 Tax=Paenibacillus radicibacter TaxID=2972488 RepID=UPI002158CE0F|nr:ATP-binding cassette domain-containing protein [Paenibacillus radicibacter]MCR8645273.1 ATP-binding cassette domain-containing protein [Paenibacillus radicibacter]